LRSRRGESVLEAIGFFTLIILLIGGLVALFTDYHGYYHMSCISSDGTKKYEAEAFGIDRLRYNVWEFQGNDDPTVVITWRGYCDSYRLN